MLLFLVGALLMLAGDLPAGPAPRPVLLPHFPDRLHAFVWRNWPLVPTTRLAKTVDAKPAEILRVGKAMGLPDPPAIGRDQQMRSALTIIRRNWHLLPYNQLLTLLDWTPQQLEYTLREDDFLYVKLGSLKPKCEPLHYHPPDAAAVKRELEIASTLRREFPEGQPKSTSALFSFISDLSRSPNVPARTAGNQAASGPPAGESRPTALPSRKPGGFSPCFCYSYFALYGDPLLDPRADPYPDAYLKRLAASGIDGVWLQAVLYKLAPFPWDRSLSERYEERQAGLRKLVARAKRHGIGVYLYLNEPRAMPLAFYRDHPAWKGAVEGDHAALCTSSPEVQRYITDSVASICRAAPDLAGLFTITASENLTNCWSHGRGAECPRCGPRGAAAVIAEVNGLVEAGIKRAGARTRLIAWDWGWPDAAARAIIDGLPAGISLMSVSEWNLPIQRGGVDSVVGEYSLSAIGPGPRARQHWEWARQHGLHPIAKIQAANSWELSAIPYIPAMRNVAEHAARLRAEHVDGLMAGWTLGGYPSPNLEIVQEVAGGADPDTAMLSVARRRFGENAAPGVVRAWRTFSEAFQEFPFHIGLVYTAPMQFGPSNLLCSEPTGYCATMIGFPYDDLDTWRAVYPPDVFVAQFRKVAHGFDRGLGELGSALHASGVGEDEAKALRAEMDLAEAAALHFRSTANQARFVVLRRELGQAKTTTDAGTKLAEIEQVLNEEIALARRLCVLQCRDARIGFEASNQYYYVPIDLMEKVLNCADLRDRWLPAVRARLAQQSLNHPSG